MKLDKQTKQQLIELLQNRTMPLKEIAKQFGVATAYLSQLNREAGIGKKYIATQRLRRPSKYASFIKMAKAEGLSNAKIAKLLVLSRERVGKIVKKEGLQDVTTESTADSD